MNKSYADVLESYMIAEEAEVDTSKPMTRAEKIKAGLVLGGLVAAGAASFYLDKKDKKRRHEIEKEKKKAEEEAKRKKAEDEAFEKNQIRIEFNRKKALEESRLKLDPIPDKDPKVIERLGSLVVKDLRLALPKILATKEVNDGIEKYCDRYNKCPKEERNDRFYDMAKDYAPDIMTSNWVKSQFKIGLYDREEYRLYIDTCNKNFFWRYGTNAIQDVLMMYIEHRYMHYLDSSDNSEGGWIEFYCYWC